MTTPKAHQPIFAKLDLLGSYHIAYALRAADIIGVTAGIKPACFVDFENNEKNAQIWDYIGGELAQDIKDLGLKVDRKNAVHEGIRRKNFSIAKTQAAAEKTTKLFEKLLESERCGKEHSRIDQAIGKILGYPESAIAYYCKRQKHYEKTGELWPFIKKYRFFAHSPEKQDSEFAAYDRKIYDATKSHLPLSWQLIHQDNIKNHKKI